MLGKALVGLSRGFDTGLEVSQPELDILTARFEEDPSADEAMAMQIYASLSGLAGAIRIQNKLHDLTGQKVSPMNEGIVEEAVIGRLDQLLGSHRQPRIQDIRNGTPSLEGRLMPETIVHLTECAGEDDREMRDKLGVYRSNHSEDLEKELSYLVNGRPVMLPAEMRRRISCGESPSQIAQNTRGELRQDLVGLQVAWLRLTVDYMLYSAQNHKGDLSQVPFLVPTDFDKAEIQNMIEFSDPATSVA